MTSHHPQRWSRESDSPSLRQTPLAVRRGGLPAGAPHVRKQAHGWTRGMFACTAAILASDGGSGRGAA